MSSWTAAGTGAVTRSVQDKLREWPSIEDFGAIGVNSVSSGLVDCTAAIQASIDAVSARGGGFVLVPAKVYGAGSTIRLTMGVHLMGLTPEGWFEGYRFAGAAFENTGVHLPTYAGRIQAMSGFSAATNLLEIDYGVASGNHDIHRGWGVSGIILDAHRFAQDALSCDGTGKFGEKRIVIDRVYCTGATRNGLALLNTIGAQVSRFKANGNNRRGINMQFGCADTQLTDIWLQGNQTNIYVGEGSINNNWAGGKCEDANGIGLRVSPAGDAPYVQFGVSGVTFQGNEGPGVAVDSQTAGTTSSRNTILTLNHCLFTGNGRGLQGSGAGPVAGTTDQVAVKAAQSARVMVNACVFDRYIVPSPQTEYGLRATDNSFIFSSHNKWLWDTRETVGAGTHYLEESGGKVVDRTGDCIDVFSTAPEFMMPKYDFT